jgi:hypothetical protein
MRRLLTTVVLLTALAVSAEPALAGPTPALTSAPSNFTCGFVSLASTNDAVECSWDPLTGATKYSVDVVANYALGTVGGTMSADFDFGTTLTVIDIPLSSFPTDINGDGVMDTLLSLVLRVKGLAPPGKTVSNQHNPFSATFTCIISTAVCSQP